MPGRRSTHVCVRSTAGLALLLLVSATARGGAAEDVPAAVGPPLTTLATKLVGRDWLVAWLMKPSRVRPGTVMPDFDPTPEEAQAMAAALYPADAARHPGATPPWQGGDPRIGERLFVERGCRGCHAIAPAEPSLAPRVPNLAGVGLKVQGAWLFEWLRSPRGYDPATTMPRLVLEDDEIRHLVSYLLAQRAGADVLAAAPRAAAAADAHRGRELLVRFECASCHRLPGAPAPPAFAIAAAASDEAVLANGRLLVARYHCRGCHRIEGSGGAIGAHLERKTLAPPTLEGEGARVQPSWLVAFLRRPQTLRPWLAIRMPDYGLGEDEARAFAAYFAALAGVPASDEAAAPAAAELTAQGLRRFAHYKCMQCHPAHAGAELPAGVDHEDLSINLGLARSRLRPSWMRAFLASPKTIVGMQTRMPGVFYSADGTPKVERPTEDIEAITAFLLHASEPPDAAVARLAAERKAAAEQPTTDWTTVQY